MQHRRGEFRKAKLFVLAPTRQVAAVLA